MHPCRQLPGVKIQAHKLIYWNVNNSIISEDDVQALNNASGFQKLQMFFLSGALPQSLEETVTVSRGGTVRDMWGPQMSPWGNSKMRPWETTCPGACDLQSNITLKVIKSSEEHVLGGEKKWYFVVVNYGVKKKIGNWFSPTYCMWWIFKADTKSGLTSSAFIIQSALPSIGQVLSPIES